MLLFILIHLSVTYGTLLGIIALCLYTENKLRIFMLKTNSPRLACWNELAAGGTMAHAYHVT